MDQIGREPVTWRSWAKARLLELAISLVLFWAAVQIVEFIRTANKAAVAAAEWMVVREVFVPNHEIGSNPEIIYDRDVLVATRGFWIVEVQRRDADGLNFTECSGAGVNEYETTDAIPDDKVTWEWFIGRECAVGPGTYRLRVSYDLTREASRSSRSSAVEHLHHHGVAGGSFSRSGSGGLAAASRSAVSFSTR